jgi:lysozyme
MDILITEEQLKKIISEQQKFNYDPKKVAFDPTKDNVPKSDYLGKGGEFERSQRLRGNIKTDKNPIKGVKTFSDRAVELIKKWEKFSSKTYICPAGYPTIGYGTRIDFHPELKNKTLTEPQALKILKDDINNVAVKTINQFVKVPLNQNEFDALVSLIYNIGRKRFINSKLLNDINSNNLRSLRKNWSEFRKEGGGISAGLVNRRSTEISLFGS